MFPDFNPPWTVSISRRKSPPPSSTTKGQFDGFGDPDHHRGPTPRERLHGPTVFRRTGSGFLPVTGMLAEMGLKRTKEKEAERRLRENEERYRSLFGKASDGISIM